MSLLTTFAGPSNPRLSRLRSGLVAFWKGDNVNDSGPNGYTLTPTNTPTFTAGKIGNAFTVVRASTQYLSLADNANLSMGSTDFSISLWAKWATEPAFAGLIAKGNTEAAGGEYQISYRSSTDKVRWTVRRAANDTTDFIDNETLIDPDTWYHVVATFTQATNVATIYVNGANPASKTLAGGVYGFDAANELRIGNWPGGGNFDGQIDALGVWRRVLTSDDVAYLYNDGAGVELSA